MTVGEAAASIIGKNGALGRSERLQHRSTDQIDGTGVLKGFQNRPTDLLAAAMDAG
jgi:hypothetical protein